MILSLRNSPSFKHIKSSRDKSNRTVFLFKPTVFGALENRERNKDQCEEDRTDKSLVSIENGVAAETSPAMLAKRDKLYSS